MWKQLTSSQNVRPGDRIRYIDGPSFVNEDTLFRVVRTDQHYFEILCEVPNASTSQPEMSRKVVRYFDIGYNIGLEVWIEG